ncbi:hypothetical protein CSHISOI_10079 [Colletotrichum shisoi]|uniref:Uncharacterized protein n=1 Tax=Colletotrichum shisoi TaxID=2078593 RepID=A0A5Q4BFE4_9PEZI|nr:hypothetical protein CSHISOI_10079 [Colletotrichum shisoi]
MDFLPLAEFIASRQDPAVSVPAVFSATIDRLLFNSGLDSAAVF